MRIYPHRNTHIFVKVKPGSMASTMGYIEQTAKVVAPNTPFEFSFLDDAVNEIYQSEKKLRYILISL